MPYIPVYYKTTLPTLHPSKLTERQIQSCKNTQWAGKDVNGYSLISININIKRML